MKKIFIVDGPSGCGKTSVAIGLEKLSNNIKYICSATIREKRPEEIDGKEHFFISPEEFEKKVQNNDFIGQYDLYFTRYGIEKSKILGCKAENIILTYHSEEGTLKDDIKKMGIPFKTILLLPDDATKLRERLVGRNPKIKENEIEVRINQYYKMLGYQDKYNYVFINKQGHLQELVQEVFEVINKNE